MKHRLLFFFVIFIIGTAGIQAQDKHYSQFYAAPLSLNPALSGIIDGKFRIATLYRDQWRRVLDNPIRTFALSSDLRFTMPSDNAKRDAMGLGLAFTTDKVPVVGFTTTQIAVSLAYHKALDIYNRQFLSLGLQSGLTQRNIDYGALTFHDQFDGSTGYTFGTGEILPGNNISFTDLNVGLNYTTKLQSGASLIAGFAIHHFLQPNVSFFENREVGDRLYTKYSGQLLTNIPVSTNDRFSLSPRIIFAVQGPHMELNAGANLRISMGEFGNTALYLGGWVRPVRSNDGLLVDALVGMLGLELQNVLLGFSYDINLNALQAFQRQTAFEFSVMYLGNYTNQEILCPKF
jgi:type IX secretion system PorP/SprF family membrane protein